MNDKINGERDRAVVSVCKALMHEALSQRDTADLRAIAWTAFRVLIETEGVDDSDLDGACAVMGSILLGVPEARTDDGWETAEDPDTGRTVDLTSDTLDQAIDSMGRG